MRGPKKKPTPAGERTPAWARRWCERGSSSDGSEGAMESTVPAVWAREVPQGCRPGAELELRSGMVKVRLRGQSQGWGGQGQGRGQGGGQGYRAAPSKPPTQKARKARKAGEARAAAKAHARWAAARMAIARLAVRLRW